MHLPPRPPALQVWWQARIRSWRDVSDDSVLRAKERGGHRIGVVIPTRDEGGTVGAIVRAVRSRDASATAHRSRDIRPDQGSVPGKGEALWNSLFVTNGDLIAFLDADLLEGRLLSSPGCSAHCC